MARRGERAVWAVDGQMGKDDEMSKPGSPEDLDTKEAQVSGTSKDVKNAT
jgi:hypothetical protein